MPLSRPFPRPAARRWTRAVVLVLAGVVPLLATGTAATAADAKAEAQRWVAPVAGPLVIDRAFDPPAQRWLSGHRGVDLVAATGSEIRAAGRGTVVYAGPLAGRGVVSIEHPSTDGASVRTTYEPVEAAVTVGDDVDAGDLIGWLAAGGHCVAVCLHWGLRLDDDYGDPLALLRPPRTRLLPHLPPPSRRSVPRADAAGNSGGRVSAASAVRVAPASVGPAASGSRNDEGPDLGGVTATVGALVAGGALLAGLGRLRTTPVRSAPSPPTGGRGRDTARP